MYLYPVQIIFWMDKHFTSNAEMSRPKQFHVSRPKRNVFLIMMLMPLFFKPSIMLLRVLLSNLMIQVIRQ